MKKIFFTTLLFHILTYSFSQNSRIFNIPSSIPKPCWVDKIDWKKPNIHVIREAIDICENKHLIKEAREENEEPYEIAFRRWLNSPIVFIQQNGDIILNSDSAKQIFNAVLKKQDQNSFQRQQKNTFVVGDTTNTNNVAHWIPLGPKLTYGDGIKKSWQANIYSIAIAPTDPKILYCGSETGIIFKSNDKGLNWYSISDALPRNVITAIAVSPNSANTIYASGDAQNMIKSIDGGVSWVVLNFPGGMANKIIINSFNGRILAASVKGIYYSDNGGSNWTKSSTSVEPGTEIFDIAFNPANPSIVYSATAVNTSTSNDMVLYLSTNGGQSFTTATIPSNTYSIGARFGVSVANPNYSYCITLQNDVPKLLVSTNSGRNWITKTTFIGTGLGGTNSVNGMSNGQGFYDLDIVVSPSNINNIIVGTTSAFKSTDGGLSFKPLGGYAGGPFAIHPDIQCMAVAGNDTYITTDGGVNYSPDFFTSTTTFEPRNFGLTASDNWGFGQGWSEDIVVGGRYHNGNATLYELYGSGNALQIGGAEDATGHVFEIPGETAITGFKDLGNTLKKLPSSLNGTNTETRFINTIWPSDDFYGQFSSKLMQDPFYANIFYVGNGNAIWKSENYGSSYVELKNFGSAVWRFDVSRSDPDIIYVCTQNGIFKTIDKGNTWNQITLPSGIKYAYYNTDIAINPANHNEIWFCMANGAASDKVFKSTDGGSSWINYTGTTLNNKYISFILSQGGTNSGVYAINSNQSGQTRVYYRDALMSDWIDYSGDLPNNFVAKSGGIIFYRDNKLRLTGNRGTWESALYTQSKPLAMPLANKKFVFCSKDTVIFRDHSILEYTGATWKWSFPGASFVSSTSTKEVKVTYPKMGNYSVTLTVTDAKGNSSTRTIQDMIKYTIDACSADSIPGNSLKLNFDKQFYSIGTANINSNNFTISCWFRPNGFQNSFAQLISHDTYPGSKFGFGLGFSFLGYTPNLNLCYTDNFVGYGNSTNAIADSTKWNHAALVYSPTGVIIYLNGVPYAANTGAMPVLNLSKSDFYINKDIHYQGGDFKGEIDEIKIYNYALSQDEVREKMHLIQSNALQENGLEKYVQFNLIDSISNITYELINSTPIFLQDIKVITPSSAPVGLGTSFRKNMISGGRHTFTGVNVDLYWSAKSGTIYPNGELVISKIKPLPTYLPDSSKSYHLDYYYIINNFGYNKTFSPLDSIKFSNLNLIKGYYVSTNFKIFKRPSFAYDKQDWGPSLASTNYLSGSANGYGQLTFSGLAINSFSQFVISTPIICNIKNSIITAADISLCYGDATKLYLSENYDSTLYTFNWYVSDTLNGSYSEIGKDSAGLWTGNLRITSYFKCLIRCKSNFQTFFTTPIIKINVSPLFTFTSQPSLNKVNYCLGTLSVPIHVGLKENNVIKYEWFKNLTSSNAGGVLVNTNNNTLNNSFNPPTNELGTSFYYCIIYSSDGCFTKSNVSGAIVVNDLPSPPLTNNVTVCIGEPNVTLQASASIGDTLKWYGSNATGGLASTAPPITSTSKTGISNYYVSQVDINGCESNRALLKFTVNQLPSKPLISWNSMELSVPPSYSSYQWLFNDIIINGANYFLYKPIQSGSYKIIVTNTEKCAVTSVPYDIIVTGITDLTFDGKIIHVYPNPFQNSVTIDLGKKPTEPITLSLFDIEGKLICKWDLKQERQEIILDNLNVGTYIFHLLNGVNRLTIPLIKK